MAKPHQESVRRILAQDERGEIIRASISEAWQLVAEKYPDVAWWRRRATRAGLVWEYAVDLAIKGLDGRKGVKPVPHHDTVSFIFDDAVLVRLKKADMQLRTSNYPTLLALSFHTHEADLFGYEGLQRVEAAYVLNRFETGVDWIGIVAREEKRHLWEFEIEKQSATIEALPLPPKTETAAERVMRPKSEPANDADVKERE